MGKRRDLLVPVVALGVALSATGAGAGEPELDPPGVVDAVMLMPQDVGPGYEQLEFNEVDIPSGEDCKGFRRSERQQRDVPQEGVVFSRVDGTGRLSSEVAVFPKVKAAKRYTRGFADGQECLAAILEEVFADAGLVGLEGLEPRFEDLGDQTVADSVRLDIAEGNVELYLDIVLVRVGSIVTGMNFQGVGAPFPDAESLVDLVVERMEDAP